MRAAPPRWERARRAAPALAGLALGLLALGPALGPGLVLRGDMAFVPDPPLTAAVFGGTGGFPRAVPSDAAVALLGLLLPVDLVQKAVLLAIFVLAAAGAAALVPSPRTAPRLAAAVGYAWSLYLAERLLIGQWALLLGYAGLPYAVRAAAGLGTRGGLRRLVLALVPAAVGGVAAMTVSGLTVAFVAAAAAGPGWRARAGALGRAALVLAGLGLPWLVPALASEAGTDPAGVDAFAARAETPFGTVPSLLALGGIWNAEAVPPGQDAPVLAAARLVLALVAIGGYLWPPILSHRRRAERTDVRGWPGIWAGLAAAALAGFAVAALGVSEPGRGLLRGLVAAFPGFGVLRDGQLYLAPLALVQALGLAALVDLARRALERRPGSRTGSLGSVGPAGAVVLAAAILTPVALSPALAWGAAGRLGAVDYPASWQRARAVVDGDPEPGAVAVLPWGAYRGYGWNGGRPSFDPVAKLFERRTLWNDELRVGDIAVAGEDPWARRVSRVLATPGPVTAALAAAGIRYVVVDQAAPGENMFQFRLPGARVALATPDMIVYRLEGVSAHQENAPPGVALVVAWGVTFCLIFWSIVASGSSLVTPLVRSAEGEQTCCASSSRW